jgi:hypothetical protein
VIEAPDYAEVYDSELVTMRGGHYERAYFYRSILWFPRDVHVHFDRCYFHQCDFIDYQGEPAIPSTTSVPLEGTCADGGCHGNPFYDLPLDEARLLGPQARAMGATHYRKDLGDEETQA